MKQILINVPIVDVGTLVSVKQPCILWKYELGGRFKNAYELLTLRALKISMFHKRFIFQCMGKIFCM